MNKSLRKIKTVLVPIGTGSTGDSAVSIAKAIAEEVILVGVAAIGEGESISAASETAREIRKRLLSMSESASIRYKANVIVSEKPWKDLQKVIAAEKPDLFLAEVYDSRIICNIPTADLLSNSLCDVAIVRGAETICLERMLIPIRGGPHAELALRVGLSVKPSQLDVLHLSLSGKENDAPFKGMKHILRQLPEVNFRSIVTSDNVQTIFEEANQFDFVVLGMTASASVASSKIGPVAEKLLRESKATIMIVKTRRPINEFTMDESAGSQAISILVDKWFAENTLPRR